MKVCQIAYTGFGGLGNVVFSLVAGRPGPDPQWAIGFVGDQALEPTYSQRCDLLGIKHESFQIAPGRRLATWTRLAQWLKSISPDVVVCHSITSIFACWWYAKWNSALLVAVEHTSNQIKSSNERIASRFAMALADRVVLLTSEYASELRIAHGRFFRPEKICIIPNGVDVDLFRPSSELAHNRTFRIGMAGRFSFSKRQDLLISAVELLDTTALGVTVELSFAGNGDEFERVKLQAAGSTASKSISFEGLLDEAGLADWFRTLDAYVHATDGETLSTALLQAMATGLPIVASDVPGIANLLAGEPVGCCVTNDARAFADAIASLIRDRLRRENMGLNGRARAVKHYSIQSMAERYFSTFDTVRTRRPLDKA